MLNSTDWYSISLKAVNLGFKENNTESDINKAKELFASVIDSDEIDVEWPYIKYAALLGDDNELQKIKLYEKAYNIKKNIYSCLNLIKIATKKGDFGGVHEWYLKLIDIDYEARLLLLPKDFSPEIYKEMNSDLDHMTKDELIKHYISRGILENRVYKFEPKLNLQVDRYSYCMPRDSSTEKINTKVKVIAHYFPQFHVIPENEEWWGKGFTDWVNVKKAQPSFNGHYQPHIPDDYLGYYDQSDINIQKKQIELAKQYGIHGFCFYMYWFDGKKLLDKPLDNFLNNKELDFPFCISWANENWTRRWDGLDNELLIAQKHSDKDDIEFIKHVSKYLKDPRYIRINNKPVILVYRPKLFPDIKQTAKRWRDWCKKNGIEDIYLIYMQSFENVDPKEYDFDAASEFPPLQYHFHDRQVGRISAQSIVYDWLDFPKYHNTNLDKGYKLFRGLCPGWDNSARKKNRASIFINENPLLFEKWAEDVFTYTIDNYSEEERLVFVNAWNEWGEGCHLEPDKKYGYGWLQAIKNAHITVNKKEFDYVKNFCKKSIKERANKQQTSPKEQEIAIFFHAYYPEILHEAIDYLLTIPRLKGIWFLVTTPQDKIEQCKKILNQRLVGYNHIVIESENKGRDILPFFKNYDLMIELGIKVFCKLHSKVSIHRFDGYVWRKELFDGLLNNQTIDGILSELYKDTNTGIILPKKYIFPLSDVKNTVDINFDRVRRLVKKMNMHIERNDSNVFPAGSMFWSRIESLIPMHRLCVDTRLFENETGTLDQTFAHICERMFSLSAKSIGLETVDTSLFYKQ